MKPTPFLDTPLPGGTVQGWLVAAGIAAIALLGMLLIKPMLVRYLQRLSARTNTRLDDALLKAVEKTRWFLVLIVALAIGSQSLQLSKKAALVIKDGAAVAAFLQIGLWLSALLTFWISRSRLASVTTASASAGLGAMGVVAQVLLWSVVTLLAMDNLGIHITTLMAGLGIGGVAVALAVQNILGDLFASLSILVDKPFLVGDFIISDTYMGTVENIGLKTTRVRSLDGEQIIFSNSDLLKSRLRNYKRMYERRVQFVFKLPFATPPDVAQRVPATVKAIVEAQKKIRFERSHFARIGDYALEFETVYWVLDPDYNLYMDTQQNINLQLMRALSKEKAVFAYPTNAQVNLDTRPGADPQPQTPAGAKQPALVD